MTIAGVRAYVLERDGSCVIALLDKGHRCQGPLTLGHVREHPGGMRRDDAGWCIAQCLRSNELHDESRLAAEVRAYLLAWRRAEEWLR